MEIKTITGKTFRVSDDRYEELKLHPDNQEDWLNFRVKHLGCSVEECIFYHKGNIVMHVPGSNGETFPKNESGQNIVDLREVFFYPNHDRSSRFQGSYYCVQESNRFFDTPEKAYEYAMSLPLRKDAVV